MYTQIGNRRVYTNFKLGTATHPEDEKVIYLVAHDNDSEEILMFEIPKSALAELSRELTRSASGVVVAGAHEMPKERRNGL